MINHYAGLKGLKKKKFRASLESQRMQLKELKNLLENNLIASISEQIEMIDQTIRNVVSIEEFIARSKQLCRYRSQFLTSAKYVSRYIEKSRREK